jgi:hydroxymethylpyrimidine pyrophosphatase-like HAD family hydrolase
LVLAAIKDRGFDLEAILNKDSLMVLPSGTNKGTGLEAALRQLGLSARNVVGLGDAENDEAFLRLCGCSVAVANALDCVKERVDLVTEGDNGRGVSEILQALLADGLAGYAQGAAGLQPSAPGKASR